jgi:tetratricopeptide (TPR) repeat protein
MILRSAVVAALAAVLLAACVEAPPPATATAPRFPGYALPAVPTSLAADAASVSRHQEGWRRLQAGDLRGARSVFEAILKQTPAFYPAEAGLGYVELANRKPREASERFAAVLTRDDAYLPAWVGQAEALLALDRDADAIAAIERVLALDPARDDLRTRLELVRFRFVQSLIETGQEARAAGRVDQARQVFEQALSRSPSSPLILHELTRLERDVGNLDRAEQYARQAVALDEGSADDQVTLAEILEARGRLSDAAAAYERAAAIDARAEWAERAVALRTRAKMAALPPEFAGIATAEQVTRGQLAAFIGIRLESLVGRAPAQVTDVATDVRRHWAAEWILRVTRAGIMPVYPNHTFQPGATVTRADLAAAVAQLVRLAGAGQPDLARWHAARPRLLDVPPSNVTYRAIALAIAAGAMSADARGDFGPTRPATGPDLEVAVRRIERLSTR